MKLSDKHLPTNFGKITNQLYRSACPNSKQIQYLGKIINLSNIIDISDRPKPIVLNTSQRLGINYYKIPLSDSVIDEPQILAILQLIEQIGDQPTLIHCYHGRHRTGLIASIVLAQQGIPFTENLQTLFAYQFGDPLQHLNYFNWILKNIC